MPSYSSYKGQMAVLDAKNDNIESWITVKGNHIPIMKGQSKEDAVKSFLLFELKTRGVKNPDKYETALKMLIQTIEFVDEKDLEALSKIKRNG